MHLLCICTVQACLPLSAADWRCSLGYPISCSQNSFDPKCNSPCSMFTSNSSFSCAPLSPANALSRTTYRCHPLLTCQLSFPRSRKNRRSFVPPYVSATCAFSKYDTQCVTTESHLEQMLSHHPPLLSARVLSPTHA